jgi:aquaporin Z
MAMAYAVNPARSLGPAVVAGELHDLWLYLVAPPVGAVIGALAHQLVRGSSPGNPATKVE